MSLSTTTSTTSTSATPTDTRGATVFTIVPATPATVADTADVLASAFENETVMGSLITGRNRRSRLAGLFRALMASGALATGRVDVARRDDDGAVLGAAIWEAPGHHASLFSQVRRAPEFLRALGWRGLPAALRLQGVLGAYRPAEPHWYLAQIGVGDAARGAGVGSALLTSRLAAIDASGMPAYLESSNERNRALYRRYGFTTIANVEGIPGASPAAMWRRAAVA